MDATLDEAEDFEDLTVPEQVQLAGFDVAFDRAPVVACERALRASRRRASLRRVIDILGSGTETVAARPRARRRPARRTQLAAGFSLLATTLVALALTGTIV